MRFYLGTHVIKWLATEPVNFFVSRSQLFKVNPDRLPIALEEWGQDSTGYTQLSKYGRWTFTPKEYVSSTKTNSKRIGKMKFASIMDWMCEANVLAKTGKTIPYHQEKTIDNYIELMTLDPSIPWMPVIQGFAYDDYHRHIDQYASRGIDLTKNEIVGVGSICRRQATKEAYLILKSISEKNIKIHGFGLKIGAFTLGVQKYLSSSDSMAWSFAARRERTLLGCAGHINCANCWEYANLWHRNVIDRINGIDHTDHLDARRR